MGKGEKGNQKSNQDSNGKPGSRLAIMGLCAIVKL